MDNNTAEVLTIHFTKVGARNERSPRRLSAASPHHLKDQTLEPKGRLEMASPMVGHSDTEAGVLGTSNTNDLGGRIRQLQQCGHKN